MLGALRDGFWKDLVILWVASVIAGGLVVAAASQGAFRYLDAAVRDLAGSPGEYELLVHLRADVGEQGVEALTERLEGAAPGARIEPGPTLAGRRNLFVAVPDAYQTQSFFASLSELLQGVPGFEGYALLVEPSVIVKKVHPRLMPRFLGDAARLPQADFAFAHGDDLWVKLRSGESLTLAQRRLEELLGGAQVAEVRFRSPLAPHELSEAREGAVAALRADPAVASAEPLDEPLALTPGVGSQYGDLGRLRDLLARIAAGEGEVLAGRIEEIAQSFERFGQRDASAAEDGEAAPIDPEEALRPFYQALDQIDELQSRIATLSGELKDAAQGGDATGIIVALLLQKLFAQFGGDQSDAVARGGGEAPGEASGEVEAKVDPEELRSRLDALAEQFGRLQALDLDQAAATLRDFGSLLGSLDPAAAGQALGAIDQWTRRDATPGERMDLLVVSEAEPGELARLIREGTGRPDAQVFLRPAGTVEPGARTVLLGVLHRTGRIVACLVALFVGVLLFVLDFSLLLSCAGTERRIEEKDGPLARLAAAFAGGCWLAAVAGASAALGTWSAGTHVAATLAGGWCAGFALSFAAHRINPVAREQLEAAASLGLAPAFALREVVLPGGRPGLLLWLGRFSRRVKIDVDAEVRALHAAGP